MKKQIFISVVLSLFQIAEAQQAGENFFAYYPTWCMGRASSWSMNATYYMPIRTLFANRGKITHLIIFPNRDILRGDFAPYLACTNDYGDSVYTHYSGSPHDTTFNEAHQDSLNLFYNGYASPGSGYSEWIARGSLPELMDSCRSVGVKVLLGLNSVTPTVGWNTVISDSVRTQILIDRLAQFLEQHSFDGIDINVEQSPTPTIEETERFYRRLRLAIGTKLITSVPPPTKTNWYTPAVIGYHDYILPQFYTFDSNYDPNCPSGTTNLSSVFLSAPLYSFPKPTGSNHHAIADIESGNWGPTRWYEAGWPKEKIVVLFATQAMQFNDVDTMFSCLPPGSWRQFWADTAGRHMLNLGGVETWDSVHCGSYVHGTATVAFKRIAAGQKFYIPILSKQNIDSIIAWGQRNGYSNFGIYDIGSDAVPNSIPPNPLVTHISSKLNVAFPQSISLPLVQGWNLVSVPLFQSNYASSAVFPNASGGVLYIYISGTGYITVDSLELGKGYWLYYPFADTVSISGDVAGTLIVNAKLGWNIIGSRNTPIDVSSLVLSGGNTISGNIAYFYVREIGYMPITVIGPGQGVWINVKGPSEDCTITLPAF